MTLIERVALAAGWSITFDEDDASSPFVAVGSDWIYVECGDLTHAGLVVLLEELLDNGWELKRPGFYWLEHDEHENIAEPTLAAAVMLAFLAMKGEP